MTAQYVLDGFEIGWEVTAVDADVFHVSLTTRRLEDGQVQKWTLPGARVFKSEAEASRHGRYVVMGLRSVDAKGEPQFTVV